MADKQSRMQRILQILGENSTETVKNLASLIGVSEMTIRRDMVYLEQAGYIKSFHGGISLADARSNDPEAFKYTPYLFRKADKERQTEKKRIAEFAVSFLESYDSIAIDNGTTCRYMLDYLPRDLNCMLYTYSMEVLAKAVSLSSRQLGIFCFGGLYHSAIKMFESAEVVEIIKKTHIDKLFLGAVGISSKSGLSCAQQYECEMRRAIMSVSDTIYVLADSLKIDKTWYLQYGEIKDVDALITDDKITPEQKAELEAMGLTVYVV